MQRKVRWVLLVFGASLIIIAASLSFTRIVEAQDGGSPLIAIPTSTPAFTPTPTPTVTPRPAQVFNALPGYGLRTGDLPDSYIPRAWNGSHTLTALAGVLETEYPGTRDAIEELIALYQNYDVVGSYDAAFFTEACENAGIYGIEARILGVGSPEDALALTTDSALLSLYNRIFNWQNSQMSGEMPGRTYRGLVPTNRCSIPSTQHIVEYVTDRLVITVSLYALNSTDRVFVEDTLRNIFALVDSRISPSTLIASASAAATSTSEPGFAEVTANLEWSPVFREFDGVEMVLVPAGCFFMGASNEDVSQFGSNLMNVSSPQHEICFSRPFWIDSYEVTNAQFQRFGGTARRNSNWNDEFRPRERITWLEAVSFCQQRGARLPSEAEWEYAARGPSGLIYPWGSEFIAGNVATGNSTADVRTRLGGASWVGALDLVGNVLEWTNSIYRQYPFNENDGREIVTSDGQERAIRGGSYEQSGRNDRAARLSAIVRYAQSATDSFNNVGFRCARNY